MDATKRCPYCAEEILAAATKCKHCGSIIVGTAPPTVRHPRLLRKAVDIVLLIVLVLFVGAAAFNLARTGTISGKGFTTAAIRNVQQSIRTEYSARRGVKVLDVEMVRETATKLTGYVEYRVPLLGVISKRCTATFGQNGRSLWQCG